jgi:hypothetical protein
MTYIAAHPERLQSFVIGYWTDQGDSLVSEICCKASSSYEARIIAIQTVPALRAFPSLIKYVLYIGGF